MKLFYISLILLPGMFLSSSCRFGSQISGPSDKKRPEIIGPTPLDLSMVRQGLVDVYTVDPTLAKDIPLKKPDQPANRIDIQLSPDEVLSTVFLQKEVAQKLKRANEILKRDHPDLALYPVDGVRPVSVQRKAWEAAKAKGIERYFADPYHGGSFHNFGVSIDLTIANIKKGTELDMGTPMAYLGDLAEPRYEEAFLREKKLTTEQVENRRLLRRVMREAGFNWIIIEWWHFDGFPTDEVRGRYKMVE